MANENLPNPSSVLIYFLVISVVFIVYTSSLVFSGTTINEVAEKFNNMNNNLIYILVLIVGSYFINTNISKAMCGEVNWFKILFITILPWLLIFLSLYFLLEIFPGWITPFSNTIGYIMVSLLGVESKLKDILSDEGSETDIVSGFLLIRFKSCELIGGQYKTLN